MSEWKERKINEIGKVVTGNTPASKNPQDFGSEMMFVTPSDYGSYVKYINNTKRLLSDSGIKRLANRVIPENSIMVTCIGSDMGKVAMNPQPVITNQQINSIVPFRDQADPQYLYYKLVEEYDTLRVLGGDGTALPIINKSTFENIFILLPPLPQQKSIAEVLSSLDDKIDLLHQQNKTLEALAETLFKQWFVDENETITDLSHYISFQNGFAFRSNDFTNTGKFGIIKITNISFDSVDINNCDYISDAVGNNVQKKFEVNSGSFLIAMTGAEIGKIGIVGETNRRLLLNQRVGKLCDKVKGSSFLGYLFLKSVEGQDHIINTATGSAQPNISAEGILSMSVPYKTKEEQETMIEILHPLFSKKSKNLSQITQLETLRNNLLPKLMSGAVTVNSE